MSQQALCRCSPRFCLLFYEWHPLLLGKQRGVFLVLLDLSAAFDTTNHQNLPGHLGGNADVRGTAIACSPRIWMAASRQCMWTVSPSIRQSWSIRGSLGLWPQTPVVGGPHYIHHTNCKIIFRHGVDRVPSIIMGTIASCTLHSTQASLDQATDWVVDCIRALRSWMVINKLKFTDDKAVAVLPCRVRQRGGLNVTTTEVGGSIVSFSVFSPQPRCHIKQRHGHAWSRELCMSCWLHAHPNDWEDPPSAPTECGLAADTWLCNMRVESPW